VTGDRVTASSELRKIRVTRRLMARISLEYAPEARPKRRRRHRRRRRRAECADVCTLGIVGELARNRTMEIDKGGHIRD